MKKNDRNMFYSDYQAGGFTGPNMNMNPGMMPVMQQPSGYMMNNNYVAYGPNAGYGPNSLPEQYNTYEDNIDYESRITKLERAVRKLESRVSKLENTTTITEDSHDNLYII